MKYKIKGLRVGMGYKAGEFAEKLGISQAYLRLIESGKAKNPRRELMINIAKLLESDVNTLFFSEDE